MTAPTEHASNTATEASAAQDLCAPAQRRLLGKTQVAARLGCSERSLERLVKQGRFPAPRRYGRAVVWFEAAVEHVLGLAEQEQLQWQPTPTGDGQASTTTSMRPAEPAAPCPIPEAHELEPDTLALRRRARKAASHTVRRERTGASAEDLEGLRLKFQMPSV